MVTTTANPYNGPEVTVESIQKIMDEMKRPNVEIVTHPYLPKNMYALLVGGKVRGIVEIEKK